MTYNILAHSTMADVKNLVLKFSKSIDENCALINQ